MKSKKLNLTILFLLIAFFTAPGTVAAGELFDKVYSNDITAVKKETATTLKNLSHSVC